jgi:chromosome segregation ATPase
MSIRMIAKDLYRLQQEVEQLEQELRAAQPGNKGELEQQLRRARAERDRLRGMLEANKEPPPYRKPK